MNCSMALIDGSLYFLYCAALMRIVVVIIDKVTFCVVIGMYAKASINGKKEKSIMPHIIDNANDGNGFKRISNGYNNPLPAKNWVMMRNDNPRPFILYRSINYFITE